MCTESLFADALQPLPVKLIGVKPQYIEFVADYTQKWESVHVHEPILFHDLAPNHNHLLFQKGVLDYSQYQSLRNKWKYWDHYKIFVCPFFLPTFVSDVTVVPLTRSFSGPNIITFCWCCMFSSVIVIMTLYCHVQVKYNVKPESRLATMFFARLIMVAQYWDSSEKHFGSESAYMVWHSENVSSWIIRGT